MAEPKKSLALVPTVRSVERCELHGAYRPSERHGRRLGCLDCERDRVNKLTPDQATERAAEVWADRLIEAGVYGRFLDATFDNFIADTQRKRDVLAACTEFAAAVGSAPMGGLMLLGPVGVGKTHLLSAMTRHMIFERGLNARVTTPRAIVRALRACWVKGATRTEGEVIDAYSADLDVLLIDEAGMGFGTDAELTQLFEVIDECYLCGVPMVVAGNLNVPGLKQALGDRIFDRLREGARVISCDWPSHRDSPVTRGPRHEQ